MIFRCETKNYTNRKRNEKKNLKNAKLLEYSQVPTFQFSHIYIIPGFLFFKLNEHKNECGIKKTKENVSHKLFKAI